MGAYENRLAALDIAVRMKETGESYQIVARAEEIEKFLNEIPSIPALGEPVKRKASKKGDPEKDALI